MPRSTQACDYRVAGHYVLLGARVSGCVARLGSGLCRTALRVVEAVWTGIPSGRAPSQPVEIALPAGAMQLPYVGWLQSSVRQTDHRSAVGRLEVNGDNRGSWRNRNPVSLPTPSEDDPPRRHDLNEMSRCGGGVRHDHSEHATCPGIDLSADTLPCGPPLCVGKECENRRGR